MSAAALAVAALTAAPADAAVTGVNVSFNPANGALRIIAGSAANGLLVTTSGNTTTIGATAGPAPTNVGGCVQLGSAVRCTNPTLLLVSLGGGDDAFTYNGSLPTTIEGQSGDDRINGGSGPDQINGDNRFALPGSPPVGGDDVLKGNGGDDRLFGSAGIDDASGGPGTDSCLAEIESGCELD